VTSSTGILPVTSGILPVTSSAVYYYFMSWFSNARFRKY